MSPNSMSDAELLELLMDGVLSVDIRTAAVTCRGRSLKPTIVGTAGKNGTRLRIEVRHNGRKRSIVRAKLVYMAGNMREIPEGYEIHHRDGDRYNDAFDNLILLTVEDHKKIHDKFCYERRAKPVAEGAPF